MNSAIVCCPTTGSSAVGTAELIRGSCSDRWAEPHLEAIELTQFSVTEENAVYVLIHLLKPNLFVTENSANENSTLVPTDVSAVVHSPRLK
jgi:hypothetical protein